MTTQLVTTEPAPRLGPGTDIATPCTHWNGARHCGVLPTKKYLDGYRCVDHTPAALAGRPESMPDPARTVAGLRSADNQVVIDMPTVGRVVLR